MISFTKISKFLRPRPHYERPPLRHDAANIIFRKTVPRRAMEFLFDYLGKYVFFDREKKLYLYFLLGTILAFLGRLLEPLPRFYLTQKRNLLNDYFVKLGLLWTSTLLLPFIFFTSKVYSGNNLSNIARQMTRLLVSFLIWFIVTAITGKVEHCTGICSLTAYGSRSSCLRNGGNWFAFEISGHCFLLVYCSLTIAEELLVFRDWHLIPRALKRFQISTSNGPINSQEGNDDDVIVNEYRSNTDIVHFLFVLCAVCMLLWDVMFLITNLYYHTWLQNICGMTFGAGGWYLTYGSWYHTPYSPGMPGRSKLKDYIDSRKATLAAAG